MDYAEAEAIHADLNHPERATGQRGPVHVQGGELWFRHEKQIIHNR
jgi:hypothetical protein